MTTANHLINALAAQNKDEANLSFEAMIQDKIGDFLEVRKVELASTILDDLQEGSGSTAARQYVRQVASIGRAYTKDGKTTRRSIHQGELKAHAAKNVKKLGADTVQYHADVIKAARVGAKVRAKVDAMKNEETLEEGGPTRKHFQQTADLIKNIEHPEKRKEMADPHASLFAQQNPRFDKSKFMKAAGVNEALEPGSAPSNAKLNANVMANIRRAVSTLGVKGVNPSMAAAGHRDFGKLVAKNPKAPGYALLRKLAPGKAAAVQSLTQAGVPLGASLEASPQEFNQVVQRIKRFK